MNGSSGNVMTSVSLAPLAEGDQRVAGDLVGEAGAAAALDAALAVEQDEVRDRDRLLPVALLLDEARLAGTERERRVLQRALAAAVAHRAVERVVDEQELEHAVLRLATSRPTAGVHDHAVGDERRAGRSAGRACPRPRRGTCGTCRPASCARGSRSAGCRCRASCATLMSRRSPFGRDRRPACGRRRVSSSTTALGRCRSLMHGHPAAPGSARMPRCTSRGSPRGRSGRG